MAAVEPELAMLVSPEAFDRSSTLVAPVFVKVMDSIAVIDVGVTEPVMTATSSSLPAPPSKLSPEFRVCRLPVDNPPSNVSSPESPVNLFVPVVSVLVDSNCI